MLRFQPLLTSSEWRSWSEWLTHSERKQADGLQTILVQQYLFHRPDRPRHQSEVHSLQSSSLPTHLPRIHRSFHGSAESVLEMIVGSHSNNPGLSAQDRSGRSGLVVPPTYSGRRQLLAPQGTEDLSDICSGKMALWLRDRVTEDDDCPFWMGKVDAIDTSSRKLHVSWFGMRQKVGWRDATWMPWYNVLTPDMYQEMSAPEKKRYKSQIGKACLPSEDVMDLDPSQILFYNFSLRTNGHMAKSTVTAIERQLRSEQLL